MSQRSPTGRSLDALLDPRSVAVIGGSDNPARIGGRPIQYMKRAGFAGRLYPVNPKHDRVQGLPAFSTLEDVPGDVDLAVVAVPAAIVPKTLTACVAKGVKAAVVFSAGFAEAGGQGEALQQQIRDITRQSGLRVLGPNCLGLYNAERGFFATFSTTLEDQLPTSGPIGLVSQSGAYGSHLSLLATRRHMGIRYWVTTGNEADITVPECVDWLADRSDVSVIVAYAEGITDRDALFRALDKARARRKPVIFMKVGTTDVGALAARSHTASLAGSDAVYDAVFRQFGAYRAHDTEEMLDVAYAASFGVLPASRRVALLTISGGVGVQMADAAVRAGLDVAPMSDEAQALLKRDLPFAAPRNPVDITAQAFNDVGLIASNLQRILDDGRYDSVVGFFTYVASAAAMVEPIRECLSAAKRQHPQSVLALSIVGSPETIRRYEEVGCPVFEDPTRAVRAVAALAGLREALAERPPRPKIAPATPLPPGPMTEHQAATLLSDAGIPMVRTQLATTAEAAVAAASAIGYPVAMKVVSPDIVHKTDVRGVALALTTPDEVAHRFTQMMADVHRHAPTGQVDGVLVAPMIEGGVDFIIGLTRDPTFGLVAMVGLGGIFVEALGDVSFRVVPFDQSEARRMVDELRGSAVLDGRRTGVPLDTDALAATLARLSMFGAAHAETLESAEINPLRVRPAGQGVVALDALVIPRGSASEGSSV